MKARGAQRSHGRGVTRSRVVLPRGRKVSNFGRRASRCPPAGRRPALWHPLPFRSPAVAPPSQEAPPPHPLRPFSKIPPSLATQVAQEKYSGSLLSRLPGSLRRAWGRGSRDKCPKEATWGADLGTRCRQRTVSRTRSWCSRQDHLSACTPSRANSAGPQPTPRGGPLHAPASLPTRGSPPPPVRRPGRPSAHALGSRARPAPSLLLSTHSTTGEGAGAEGAQRAT